MQNTISTHHTETDAVVARAIEACAHARGYSVDLNKTAEQKLRAIREAGRLLAQVHRSAGGRRPINWSSGLTSYQTALRDGHISRQTANEWRRVADVPGDTFEQYLSDVKLSARQPTIKDLLQTCTVRSSAELTKCTITFVLSTDERRVIQRQLAVLRATHFLSTPSEALVCVVGQAYREWRSRQLAVSTTE
jgi:hypothetical protein